jgi:hypothetical protein
MNYDASAPVPTLADLARQLESNGMVVVPYRDYIQIRLSLFASVQVRIVGSRLEFEPRFGFIPRDRATWATLIGLAAITAVFFMERGVTPLSMLIAFLSVSSGASTAIRYQLTENCITRVQTAWMFLTGRPTAVGAAAPPENLPGTEAGGHARQLTGGLAGVPRGSEAQPRQPRGQTR